ncbi:MAG: carbohydrate ABC transporter permease [Saccharofermentanales bacterium]
MGWSKVAQINNEQDNTPKELRLWYRIRKGRQSYLLMAPYMLFFTCFTILPVIVSVFLSTTNYNMFEKPNFTGFDNFVRMLLDDDVFLIAIKNTLIFAFITGPISYFLCFTFAWLINELTPKVRAVATVLFYAPALSGQAFTVWLFIFSADRYGIVNGFLMRMGLINEPVAWLWDARYSMTVLILVQLWLSLGTGFLAFIAGLQSVDTTLYEAGSIDGIRNRFQELWYITLPSMVPQLVFGAVMQIVTSFTVAEVPMRLSGFPSTEYATQTIVTHILDFSTLRFELGYASAVAVFLFVLMFISNKVIIRLLRSIGH